VQDSSRAHTARGEVDRVFGQREISSTCTQPDAARALIKFLGSPAAAPAIARTGIEPVNQ
jgi:hypothetical protein